MAPLWLHALALALALPCFGLIWVIYMYCSVDRGHALDVMHFAAWVVGLGLALHSMAVVRSVQAAAYTLFVRDLLQEHEERGTESVAAIVAEADSLGTELR